MEHWYGLRGASQLYGYYRTCIILTAVAQAVWLEMRNGHKGKLS
jgi:hypothetical protein